MSYEERKRKRIRKKRIKKFLVIFVFIILGIRSISIALAKNARTTLPEKYTLVKGKEAQGVLIMNESVFTMVGTSETKDEDLEGKRVPAGYVVGKASVLPEASTLKEELREIEEAISILSRSDKENEIIEKDKENIKKTQDELIREIKEKIDSGNYSDIENIKNSLLEKNNKLVEISPDNTLLDQSLENLNNRRDELLDKINESNLTYTASMAGMLSYKIDGYENLFIPREFENYTYDNLKIPDNSKKLADEDFNGFKIIDNFEWHMAVKIDDIKDMKKYEVGNIITLSFSKDDKIKGIIVAINQSNDKMVLIVKFTKNLEKYYDKRFPKLSIIMSKEDVYKLPTRALIDKEGQIGVYIKEFSGIVRFRPLSIIERHKDYTYVDMGNERGYIKIKGNENLVRTISLYDEIIINPSGIEEGEILD